MSVIAWPVPRAKGSEQAVQVRAMACREKRDEVQPRNNFEILGRDGDQRILTHITQARMNPEVWAKTRIGSILFSVFIARIPGLRPAAAPRNVIRSNVRMLNKGAAPEPTNWIT